MNNTSTVPVAVPIDIYHISPDVLNAIKNNINDNIKKTAIDIRNDIKNEIRNEIKTELNTLKQRTKYLSDLDQTVRTLENLSKTFTTFTTKQMNDVMAMNSFSSNIADFNNKIEAMNSLMKNIIKALDPISNLSADKNLYDSEKAKNDHELKIAEFRAQHEKTDVWTALKRNKKDKSLFSFL